jgi:hypothetical protein
VKERKAYIILVLLSVGLSALACLFTVKQVHDSNHKFCRIINVSITSAGKIQKPEDPKAHPSREKLYENYILVKDLGHSLGCL